MYLYQFPSLQFTKFPLNWTVPKFIFLTNTKTSEQRKKRKIVITITQSHNGHLCQASRCPSCPLFHFHRYNYIKFQLHFVLFFFIVSFFFSKCVGLFLLSLFSFIFPIKVVLWWGVNTAFLFFFFFFFLFPF